MLKRNYENDLQRMFEEINALQTEILEKSKELYVKHELIFSRPDVKNTPPAFRAVAGDIHTKVLGKYLCHVLHLEDLKYEERIVGRIRADIQISDKITIEVKSHGQFDLASLQNRFDRITREKPQMKHIYVAFKEREDYVKKTSDALNVESFFLSVYVSEKNPERKYSSKDLQCLIEAVETALKR